MAQDNPQSLPAPAEPGAGDPVDTDWWAQAQAAIQAAEYEVTWQEDLPRGVPCRLPGAQPRPGLRTYFLPDGILIVPRDWTGDEAPAWQFRLPWPTPPRPSWRPRATTSAYRRPGEVAEWYRNEPAGLAQGFEVAAGAGDRQVVLTLAVDTDLVPTLAADGQAVDFADAEGAAVLRYAGLRRPTPTGRSLPAAPGLVARGDGGEDSGLHLQVDAPAPPTR